MQQPSNTCIPVKANQQSYAVPTLMLGESLFDNYIVIFLSFNQAWYPWVPFCPEDDISQFSLCDVHKHGGRVILFFTIIFFNV